MEAFINDFIDKPQAEVMLAIKTRFEGFQYMAHAITDYLHEAQEHAEKLEKAADETATNCG